MFKKKKPQPKLGWYYRVMDYTDGLYTVEWSSDGLNWIGLKAFDRENQTAKKDAVAFAQAKDGQPPYELIWCSGMNSYNGQF